MISGVILLLNDVFIPTDGSGHILITAVSPNILGSNSEALLCRSERSGTAVGVGNWYLHPTQQSREEEDRVMSVDARGWDSNRGTVNRLHTVRLKRVSDTAVEGVFTCHIPGDINTPVSVGIYYPSEL